MIKVDLTGRVFGRLTVVARNGTRYRSSQWLCKCDCGAEATIARGSLVSGATRSCGCLRADSNRVKKCHPSLRERFTDSFTPSDESSCWLWQKTIARHGYGIIMNKGKRIYAHRLSYETHVGPIPEGLTIDHLCRVRSCVNPKHLEPVTRGENARRGRLCR